MPGRFPWKEEYAVPLGRGDCYISETQTDFTDSIYFIAAHAVVTNSEGEIETAWTEGVNFEGENWAAYFQYKFDDCSSRGEIPS